MIRPDGVMRDDFNLKFIIFVIVILVLLKVIALCKMISMQGLRLTNGHTLILFGELFRIYQKISNKVSEHCFYCRTFSC